jgi:hypothetical protein
MKLSRKLVRIGLVLAAALAIAVASVALLRLGLRKADSWAVVAAALAVVVSVFSTWTAQRVLELQEDQTRPLVYVDLDLSSRYGLVLLRVKNGGGGVARDVRITWENEIERADGQPVTFEQDPTRPAISILLPKASLSRAVDAAPRFFERYGPGRAKFKGNVAYSDGRGSKYAEPFLIDADPYRDAPMHDVEDLKTHHELQKVPELLKKMAAELEQLRRAASKR